MAIAHAMWTHGTSIQVEYPERGTLERKGFYAKFTSSAAPASNWFHFAIPTPVIVNGTRLRAESVMIRFRTGGGAVVQAVHIYDGENMIAGQSNLDLNPMQWYFERIDVPKDPLVAWGIGISILVEFLSDGNWIEFSSGGCDFFEVPVTVKAEPAIPHAEPETLNS